VAISRSQDPYNLSEKLIPHLEVLLKIDINIDKSESTTAIAGVEKSFRSWQVLNLPGDTLMDFSSPLGHDYRLCLLSC